MDRTFYSDETKGMNPTQGWIALENESTLHCGGCKKTFRARSLPSNGMGWCATTGQYETVGLKA